YRSLDIDAHLIKPARSSALLEAIVATIQKHRQRPEEIVEQAAAEAPRLSEKAEKRPVSKPTLKVVPPPTEEGLQHKVDILVAEDNEVNQPVFTQILGETRLSCQIVGNGRLGVEAYPQLRPRMILMDVSMPE